MQIIKTPDQRLRIFISSTIQEMNSERKKVREVIERLKLTPVFFESGARPHPPRDLYRSYLEQSDVFVGIYWKSYGWISPGMEISGLEDEWRLSGNKPKLIYIKQAEERDQKLLTLLKAIEDSNIACYRKFEKVEELTELIANDLAVLLTERFQSPEIKKNKSNNKPRTNLPAIRSKIIGRANEIERLKEKFSVPELGLITLVGPGGIGKTRLALEIGKELSDSFINGVYFVQLSDVTESSRLPAIIAQTIGMNNSGVTDVNCWVLDYLNDKYLLLILDNFEQIIDAGIFVSDILNKCTHVKVLVTSRTPLYIRNENIFTVEPLEMEKYKDNNPGNISKSVELFIQRASETNSKIEWTNVNIKSAYSICNKLDGLPLGIELAAARCRHMEPEILDKKMENILDTINSGPRDFPERQQTLRNTIQWSYNLLDPEDQRLFRRLSVFNNGWSEDAVKAICWDGLNETSNLEGCIDHLIDYGLIVKLQNEYKTHKLLNIIKEFAFEKLVESKEEKTLKINHCDYYQRLANSHAQQIWMTPASVKHLIFREDYENLTNALDYAVLIKDQKKIRSLINSLNALYMVTGELGLLFEWLDAANIKSDPQNLELMLRTDSKNEVALSFLTTGFTRVSTGNLEEGIRDLTVARQFAKELNIPQIESPSLLFMAIANITAENISVAKELLLESIALAKHPHQLAVLLSAQITLHVIFVEENKLEEAVSLLDNAVSVSHSGFMPLVQSYSLYQRGYLHYYMKEYEMARQRFQESIDLNKKYNLNLNASFSLTGLAITYAEEDMLEIALENFRESLECLRNSGSKVEFLCFKYALCLFLAKTNQTEKALRLFAFIKSQYKQTKFRPWITHRICLDYAEEILRRTVSEEYLKGKINSPQELSNEEIYRMID